MTPQSSESIEDLPLSELRRFVSTLASEVGRLGTLLEAKDAQIEALEAANAALRSEVQALKDEVARLKGLPPRPKFKGKPSGMEKATSPGPGGEGRSKRRRDHGSWDMRTSWSRTSRSRFRRCATARNAG